MIVNMGFEIFILVRFTEKMTTGSVFLTFNCVSLKQFVIPVAS